MKPFQLAIALMMSLSLALSAGEYDPSPNEFVDGFFNELEGAVGGRDGKAIGLGFQLLKTMSRISYEKEAVMGETIALEAFAKFGQLTRDQQLLEYIAEVGNAVALVSDRPNTPYYFAVCVNNDPNAFAVPGGYVFITTGLLKLMKNEEELAGALGHEIAHVALQHAVKSIRAGKRVNAALELSNLFLGGKQKKQQAQPEKRPDYFALVDNIATTITEKGYPMKNEIDADKIGMEYAYRAGYRVQGLRDFLSTLAKLERSHRDYALFKTHRDYAQRIRSLDKLMQKNRYPDIPVSPVRTARFQANVLNRLR